MKKAYFFINGFLFDKSVNIKNETIIELDNKNIYQVENFGVRKNFNDCKNGAFLDLIVDSSGVHNIIENSYIAIFEIELNESDYESIYEPCNLADFDILKYIMQNQNKLIYSAKFDEDKNIVENFISTMGE